MSWPGPTLSERTPVNLTAHPFVNLSDVSREDEGTAIIGTHSFARATSVNTAWRPSADEPSVMTANAILFCRRTDFTQPLTCMGFGLLGVPGASNCRTVGVSDEARVARDRRRIMETESVQATRGAIFRGPFERFARPSSNTIWFPTRRAY